MAIVRRRAGLSLYHWKPVTTIAPPAVLTRAASSPFTAAGESDAMDPPSSIALGGASLNPAAREDGALADDTLAAVGLHWGDTIRGKR